MKLVLEKIVKEEREVPSKNNDGDKVELTGIKIGDVDKYSLRFSGSKDNEFGIFNLFFCYNDNFEFRLHMDRHGISFERVVYRPNHDHSDVETLVVRVDDSMPSPKKGTIQWLSSYNNSWEPYYIPFGAVRVDY